MHTTGCEMELNRSSRNALIFMKPTAMMNEVRLMTCCKTSGFWIGAPQLHLQTNPCWLKRPDSRNLSKCNTITLTRYCASIILGHSAKTLWMFHCFDYYNYRGEKAEGWSTHFSFRWELSPHVKKQNKTKNILLCGRIGATNERRLFQGQWDLLGGERVCVCLMRSDRI